MWPLQNYSPISWGSEDRALILGAFFYGYVVFQVHFASRSSNFKNSGAWGADGRDVRNEEGAWIQVCLSMTILCDLVIFIKLTSMMISMLMTSLLGLLTPLAAYTSIWAIFALRVAQVSAVISTNNKIYHHLEIIVVISRVCLRVLPTLH